MSILRNPYREDKLFSILAFAVFLTPLVFTWYTYEKYEIPKIALLLILTGAGIFALVNQLNNSQPRKLINILSASLIAWIIISALCSKTLLNGFFGTYPRFTSSAVFYILIIIFFWLLIKTLTREKLVFLLKILCVDSLIIAITGIMQSMGVAYYTGLNAPALQRAPGLLGNPDFSALFLAALLPVVLYFFEKALSRWAKIYYGLTTFSILAALVLFASRGAWIGAIVALVLFSLVNLIYKTGKWLVILPLLALLVGLAMWFASIQEVRPGVASENLGVSDSSVSLRLSAWDIARQAMVERPVFGTGPGNFQYFFQSHRGKDLASQNGVFDDVHNLFLQFGASLGIPFLIMFLVIITIICLKGIKYSWLSSDNLYVTLVVSIVSFLLMASFTPVSSACFLLLAVMCAGIVSINKEETVKPFNRLFKPVFYIVGSILIVLGVGFLVGEILFFQGYARYANHDYKAAVALNNYAVKFNPTNQLAYIYNQASKAHLNYDTNTVKLELAKAVDLYPYDARGYLEATDVSYLLYDKTGNPEYLQDSINYAKKAVDLDPNNAVRYGTLAMFYFVQNNMDLASFNVVFGLSLDKNIVPSWILLARILQIQGNISGSRGAIDHAYKLVPNNDIVKAMYLQSQKVLDKDYKNFPIPVLYNPEDIE